MTLMQIFYLEIKDDFSHDPFHQQYVENVFRVYIPETKNVPICLKHFSIQMCERSFTSTKVQKQFMGLH